MPLDYSQLYRMNENFRFRSAFRAGLYKSDVHGPGIITGATRVLNPLTLKWDRGSKLCDVIWTTGVHVVLVSDVFLAKYEELGFRGINTYPIEFLGKNNDSVIGYRGLVISGRAGSIEWNRSRMEQRSATTKKGKPYEVAIGIHFKGDNWDGSDIFVPEGSTHKIVTERFKDGIGALKLLNVTFERLTTHKIRASMLRLADRI